MQPSKPTVWSAPLHCESVTLQRNLINYYVLLLTRFYFGAGEAGAFPNIGISVSRWFPILERARAMGAVLMFMQIGRAIAPLVIVPIQMLYGWRTSFYVMGIHFKVFTLSPIRGRSRTLE